jgi:hypothetical protein
MHTAQLAMHPSRAVSCLGARGCSSNCESTAEMHCCSPPQKIHIVSASTICNATTNRQCAGLAPELVEESPCHQQTQLSTQNNTHTNTTHHTAREGVLHSKRRRPNALGFHSTPCPLGILLVRKSSYPHTTPALHHLTRHHTCCNLPGLLIIDT